MEKAIALADSTAAFDQARKDAVKEAQDLETEARKLAAEANAPGADAKDVALKARKIAISAMKVRGPWSRTAAEVALAGTDKDVTDYIRTGWTQAAQQDDRTRVENLALLSEIEPVRAQAVTALSGDAIKITSFLETGQYAAASDDFRVQIAQIISKGGPNVQESGRAAPRSRIT
ncbi:ALF repeat-containing protein [Streptomyces sp. SCSIO 30461]|uniref:ALF repeat-containing protein n=1 Tax=Streptomyces sp. SCSIO 30461 TaxID=3118085 RepID=UPI0030CF3CB8